MICLCPTSNFDNRHTVFARIINGYDIIEKTEKIKLDDEDRPVKQVKIVDCGELSGDWKLTKESADFLPNYSASEDTETTPATQ